MAYRYRPKQRSLGILGRPRLEALEERQVLSTTSLLGSTGVGTLFSSAVPGVVGSVVSAVAPLANTVVKSTGGSPIVSLLETSVSSLTTTVGKTLESVSSLTSTTVSSVLVLDMRVSLQIGNLLNVSLSTTPLQTGPSLSLGVLGSTSTLTLASSGTTPGSNSGTPSGNGRGVLGTDLLAGPGNGQFTASNPQGNNGSVPTDGNNFLVSNSVNQVPSGSTAANQRAFAAFSNVDTNGAFEPANLFFQQTNDPLLNTTFPQDTPTQGNRRNVSASGQEFLPETNQNPVTGTSGRTRVATGEEAEQVPAPTVEQDSEATLNPMTSDLIDAGNNLGALERALQNFREGLASLPRVLGSWLTHSGPLSWSLMGLALTATGVEMVSQWRNKRKRRQDEEENVPLVPFGKIPPGPG